VFGKYNNRVVYVITNAVSVRRRLMLLSTLYITMEMIQATGRHKDTQYTFQTNTNDLYIEKQFKSSPFTYKMGTC